MNWEAFSPSQNVLCEIWNSPKPQTPSPTQKPWVVIQMKCLRLKYVDFGWGGEWMERDNAVNWCWSTTQPCYSRVGELFQWTVCPTSVFMSLQENTRLLYKVIFIAVILAQLCNKWRIAAALLFKAIHLKGLYTRVKLWCAGSDLSAWRFCPPNLQWWLPATGQTRPRPVHRRLSEADCCRKDPPGRLTPQSATFYPPVTKHRFHSAHLIN